MTAAWLASLPGFATRGLRSLRTSGYWLGSPIESMARRLGGREPLPPLWLRRHTGPVRDFVTAAQEMSSTMQRLGVVEPKDLVLDVGCGCGAMAFEFARLLSTDGRYVGFDVHRPSIAWCRRRFASDPRFRFEIADVATPFSPGRPTRAEDYAFPASDGAAGFVLAKSLFTHLMEREARRYLDEIRRVLRAGRRALVTAFLFAPSASTPAFPFPDGIAPIRWRVRVRPHSAVAYSRPEFEALVHDAGLRIAEMVPGFWPGAASTPAAQDVLLLSHR